MLKHHFLFGSVIAMSDWESFTKASPRKRSYLKMCQESGEKMDNRRQWKKIRYTASCEMTSSKDELRVKLPAESFPYIESDSENSPCYQNGRLSSSSSVAAAASKDSDRFFQSMAETDDESHFEGVDLLIAILKKKCSWRVDAVSENTGYGRESHEDTLPEIVQPENLSPFEISVNDFRMQHRPLNRLLRFDSDGLSNSQYDNEIGDDLPDLEDLGQNDTVIESRDNQSQSNQLKSGNSAKSLGTSFSKLPQPYSRVIKTEENVHFFEVHSATGRSKNILCQYLESPSYLPTASSHSSIKYSSGDQSKKLTTVLQFSQQKVALLESLLESLFPASSEPRLEESNRQQTFLLASLTRNLNDCKTEPPLSVISESLRCLSTPSSLPDAFALHAAIKGVLYLHPPSRLPFHLNDIRKIFSCLNSNCGNISGDCNGRNLELCLDVMISFLEMEFCGSFQTLCLRKMRKSEIFKMLTSDSFFEDIQVQLLTACRKSNNGTRHKPLGTLMALKRLLGIAGATVVSDTGGISRLARALLGEYAAAGTLNVRTRLLESVSFPLHRLLLVWQVLEKWRYRTLLPNLRSLMMTDMANLLDSYFTDRFLSSLVQDGVERMTVGKVEELVMLLYRLVESFIHTAKDFFQSSFCEKLSLKDGEGFSSSFHYQPLLLLPGYVDLLKSFLERCLLPNESMSRKTRLFLIKLECLADLGTSAS